MLRFKSLEEVPSHLLRDRGAIHAPAPIVEAPKRKYRNEPVVVDGYHFDSKFQAQRYHELRNMEVNGVITALRMEPSYGLHVNGKRIGAIQPDFDYRRDGVLVVEDTKSKVTMTPIYEWKRAHLLAEYDIAIVEIQRTKRPPKTKEQRNASHP